MIGGQKIQAGLAHARKTVQVTVEPGTTITAPRTTSRDINRHKASNYKPGSCSVPDSSGINRMVSRDSSLLPARPAA